MILKIIIKNNEKKILWTMFDTSLIFVSSILLCPASFSRDTLLLYYYKTIKSVRCESVCCYTSRQVSCIYWNGNLRYNDDLHVFRWCYSIPLLVFYLLESTLCGPERFHTITWISLQVLLDFSQNVISLFVILDFSQNVRSLFVILDFSQNVRSLFVILDFSKMSDPCLLF